MTSASSGIICTISSMIRNVVRSLKRNRATAVAASSATTPLISTVPSATSALLRKKSTNVTPGIRSPVRTPGSARASGASGTGTGVAVKISRWA